MTSEQLSCDHCGQPGRYDIDSTKRHTLSEFAADEQANETILLHTLDCASVHQHFGEV